MLIPGQLYRIFGDWLFDFFIEGRIRKTMETNSLIFVIKNEGIKIPSWSKTDHYAIKILYNGKIGKIYVECDINTSFSLKRFEKQS